jgi:hypothetical protein
VDGFGDADPDVEQAEAGDDAAHRAEAQNGPELGMGVEEHVVVPDFLPPGQDGDHDSQLNAEEDEDEEGDALQPERARWGDELEWRLAAGSGGRSLRRVGYLGEKMWLNGHSGACCLQTSKVAEGMGSGLAVGSPPGVVV